MKYDLHTTLYMPAVVENVEKIYQQFYREYPAFYENGPLVHETFPSFRDSFSAFMQQHPEFEFVGQKNLDPYFSDLNEEVTHTLFSMHDTDLFAVVHPNYAPALVHDHPYYEIVYAVSGSCINYSGNQQLTLSEGDFLIIAPGTMHAISSTSDTTRILNLAIRKEAFEQAFFHRFSDNDILCSFFYDVLNYYETNNFILFHTQTDPVIRSNLFFILEEQRHQHSYTEEIKYSYLSLIFMRLIYHHEAYASIYHVESEKKHEIVLILEYMKTHYATVSLSDLSAFFGYSNGHMSRIIKLYTGKNFQKNLQHIRMTEAVRLMRDEKLSWEEISHAVGYASVHNFREHFREEFGMNPKEYRGKFGIS